MKGWRAVFLLLLTSAVAPLSSHALVVNYGNGTQNKTDPGYDLPWNNVGTTATGASGVYLGTFGGEYWVATASHVGASNFTLGSTTYSYVAGSAVQIAGSDLTLFRIASNPGLGSVTLASSSVAVNDLVTMVGVGRVESAYTKWNINTATNPDTWTVTTGVTYDKHGYTTVAGSGPRWGFGYVNFTDLSYEVGTGSTQAFAMGFVDGVSVVAPSAATFGSSTVARSMGQSGDSGGAAFVYNYETSGWELAGILGAVGLFQSPSNPDGQPGNTAVFGNVTFAIDLAAYRNDILAVVPIPEPAAFAALMGAVGWLLVLRHRRRA